MPAFRTLDDADLAGKRVLVRVDLNVPMEEGRVSDTTRIDRILPTIREIAQKGGKVILLAHFGRPKGRDEKNSLRQVVPAADVAPLVSRATIGTTIPRSFIQVQISWSCDSGTRLGEKFPILTRPRVVGGPSPSSCFHCSGMTVAWL